MSAVESGTGMTAAGSATIDPYESVGPTFQTTGYGWGTYLWGDSTWGTARTVSDVTLDPGIWSLDNFGEVLVATIHNGKTFTWDAGATNLEQLELQHQQQILQLLTIQHLLL